MLDCGVFLPSCVCWSLDKEERDRDSLISVLVLL